MPILFKTDIPSAADLRVYVADILGEADLVVYETADAWAATDAPIWHYTDIESEADKTICFVESRFDAELIIYRTGIQSEACWVNSAKEDLL